MERAVFKDLAWFLFGPFNKDKFVMYLSDSDDFVPVRESCKKHLLASLCIHVRLYGRNRLPLDGYSLKVYYRRVLLKTVYKIQFRQQWDKNSEESYMKT
jgi:hypothetical protein